MAAAGGLWDEARWEATEKTEEGKGKVDLLLAHACGFCKDTLETAQWRQDARLFAILSETVEQCEILRMPQYIADADLGSGTRQPQPPGTPANTARITLAGQYLRHFHHVIA